MGGTTIKKEELRIKMIQRNTSAPPAFRQVCDRFFPWGEDPLQAEMRDCYLEMQEMNVR